MTLNEKLEAAEAYHQSGLRIMGEVRIGFMVGLVTKEGDELIDTLNDGAQKLALACEKLMETNHKLRVDTIRLEDRLNRFESRATA